MPDKPLAVIDTQVLLDWLVFAEPRVAPWVEAIEQGAVGWIASPAMRRELAHMASHPSLARWQAESERVLSAFDRWAVVVAEPTVTSPRLRCRDADDQVFIDLALQHRARWLVTRDKALLSLARRARPLGTEIVKPWT
jgi:uncharacterized protein